jgi:hypothetical protein
MSSQNGDLTQKCLDEFEKLIGGENRTGRHLKLNSRMKLRCGRLKYQIFQFSSVTEFLVMSDAFLRNWLHSGGGLKFVPTGVA